jgi:1-acyl-sn-glycerol-3-phosphate acyltransferase
MLWSHGIRLEISGPGAKHLNNFKGVIFVSNHQSIVDIFIGSKIFPRVTSFIAKKELKLIPIFGWAAAVVGVLFIDRARGAQNKSLSSVGDLLRCGFNFIIYPEGTRSPDGKILPFKRGAFVMAISSQVPVVPVTILDTYRVCPKHHVAISPGTVHVIVDDPISTIGLKIDDRHALSDQVHSIMSKHLEKFEESRDTQ